jgi:hypothetical protein
MFDRVKHTCNAFDVSPSKRADFIIIQKIALHWWRVLPHDFKILRAMSMGIDVRPTNVVNFRY